MTPCTISLAVWCLKGFSTRSTPPSLPGLWLITALKMEVASLSQTSGQIYCTIRCINQNDHQLIAFNIEYQYVLMFQGYLNISCFVDRAFRNICVMKTNLMRYLSSVYFVNQPLHFLTFCWPCIPVINQLDAQNFCFTISLVHASTCFEHMCSSSGGCLVHETATYRCDDTIGCVMQFWPPDDDHMWSKHVEAWNKLIVKQKFCASSWLITEINNLYMFQSYL